MSEMSEGAPSAGNGTGVESGAEPCWYAETPEGHAYEYGDGSPHWTSEDEGRTFLAYLTPGERKGLTLSREDAPCWHLSCVECGYRYDEEEWVGHFYERIDAENAAEDSDWTIRDGRHLCPACELPAALAPPVDHAHAADGTEVGA